MHSNSLLSLLPATFILLQYLLPTTALRVGTSSPCYDTCDGKTNTETQHLSCIDAAYDPASGTAGGKRMRQCLPCLEKSTYANKTDSETDQYWFMFHLKYTQQYCLFDGKQISDCATECAPLSGPLRNLWGDTTPPQFLWDYCDETSGIYPSYAGECAACLKARSGTVVLANFMETMAGACTNKPNVSTTGDLFDIVAKNGDLWNTETEKVATTAGTTTKTPPTASSTGTPSSATDEGAALDSQSSSNSTSSITNTTSSGLSSGATIGIGVAAALIALAAIGALVFFCLRRKRARRNATTMNVGQDSKAGFIPMDAQSPGQQQGAYGSPYSQTTMQSPYSHQQQMVPPYGGSPMGHGQDQKYGYIPQAEMQGSGRMPAEMSAREGTVSEMDAGGRGNMAELPGGHR